MQIKVFNIPVSNAEESTDLLNRFLRANKIISIEKQFYLSSDPCWTVLVTYLPGNNVQEENGYRSKKVDYKATLPADVFEVFSKLRAIRKRLAADDAVPAYAVFTDAELARIAALKDMSAKGLATIEGVGEARIAKYGVKMIQALNEENGTSD